MTEPPDHRNANAADLGRAARRRSDTKNQSRNSTPRRFVVTCQKREGRDVVFGRYADANEAHRIAKLLRWAGSIAKVEIDEAAA